MNHESETRLRARRYMLVKRRRARLRAEGRCIDCGKPAGRWRCIRCQAEANRRNREYREDK